MDDQKPKSNIHIHIGGIVLLIIIIFLLFKVDIKTSVNNPQFKSNIEYIEKKVEYVYENYIVKTFEYIWHNLFNLGMQKIKENTPNVDVNKFNLGGMQGEKNTDTPDVKPY